MKFFTLKQLLQSWSVQVWALVPVLATIDYSATFDRSTKTMFGFSTNWDIFA